MSSILTNNGAMVALQTLKSINMDLEGLQSQISTGKKVANASDNSAVWAIAKTMESDVGGFKAVSESLSLGKSTVAVAQSAAESVTELLTQMKEKIVAADGENVDRGKLQDDVNALREQIDSVVGAAQFNGLNLVNGGTGTTILSSLDRDSTGAVSTSSITVAAANLGAGNYVANDVFDAGGGTATVTAAGDSFALALDGAGGTETITIQDGANPWAAGDSISLQVGDQTVSYTVTDGDVDTGVQTFEMVASGLKSAIDELGITGLEVGVDASGGNAGELTFTNNGTDSLTVGGSYSNAAAGGLAALSGINVGTAAGATAAIGVIDTLISTAIDAAASFGSVQGRIEAQSNFVSNLTDSLTSGIGSLVDADMEKASARLKALQTQQQLGAQALSIANSAPQSLLSLFR